MMQNFRHNFDVSLCGVLRKVLPLYSHSHSHSFGGLNIPRCSWEDCPAGSPGLSKNRPPRDPSEYEDGAGSDHGVPCRLGGAWAPSGLPRKSRVCDNSAPCCLSTARVSETASLSHGRRGGFH